MAERISKKATGELLVENIGVLGKDWQKGDIIGRGGFGKVYLVEFLKEKKKPKYVVKELSIEFGKNEEYKKAKVKKSFVNETDVLKIVGTHKRIVPFIGASIYGNTLFIFMKYFEKGSLKEYSRRLNGLTEEVTRRFTRHILEALEFLHKKNILHRDVKGDNVLMQDESHVRLTDFGLSKILQDVSSTATQVGTTYWMAPEVARVHSSSSTYNEKADIWSVGCTVIEMMTGNHPTDQMKKLYNGTLPSLGKTKVLSKEIKGFLQKTFQEDPEKRPSATNLLVEDHFVNRECIIKELNRKLENVETKNKHLLQLNQAIEKSVKEVKLEKSILEEKLKSSHQAPCAAENKVKDLKKELETIDIPFDKKTQLERIIDPSSLYSIPVRIGDDFTSRMFMKPFDTQGEDYRFIPDRMKIDFQKIMAQMRKDAIIDELVKSYRDRMVIRDQRDTIIFKF